MSTVRDPARLVVDASAPNSERELLRHGVDIAPPSGAEARVWQGLAGVLGAAAGGVAAGGAAADASTKTITAATKTAATKTAATKTAATKTAATKAAGAGLAGAKVVAIVVVVAGLASVGGYLLTAAGRSRPTVAVAPATVPPVSVPPAPPGPTIGAAAPPADAPRVDGVDGDEPAPKPPGARKLAVRAPSRPAAAAPSSAGRLREETTLIRDARQALRQGDAARALRLLDECRRLFPGGVLQQERERLAIEALTKSGRTAEASARAAAFLRRYPDSPHAGEIRGLGLGGPAARGRR